MAGTGSTADSSISSIYTVDQVYTVGGEGGSRMATVLERNEGHYKVHKLPYAKDYVWCPRCVLVECDCGEMLVLSASLTTCGCGADHAALVREELASRRPSEGVSRPLEDEHSEWRKKHEEFLHSESHYWLEWRFIE
jgi:hypothetical protein